MTISWKPRVWKTMRPATLEDIAKVEQEWGVSLPDDYKRLAITHQGMMPTPDVLDIGRGNTVVSELLTLSFDEEHWASSMLDIYPAIRDYIPQGIYPFMSTGAGDFICFDYRSDPNAPKVVFYFTEEAGERAIHWVANSFTEFLSKPHGR